MAAYFSGPHSPHPQYNYASYHKASLYPHLYSASTYSLPVSRNHSRSFHSSSSSPSPSRHRSDYAMPTYYVTSSGSGRHRSSSQYRDSRPRSSSHSHHHHGSGHSPQPVVYTSSNVYPRDYAHGDSGRRHRSSSVGHGGTHSYYPSSGHRSSHGHSPQYYTTTTASGRRHSTSHHYSPQVIDARHSSSSGRRPSVSYGDAGHSRSGGYHYHNEPLGDRVRRWFGLTPAHHRSTSRSAQYVDARTGHPVDERGRRIYRV